MANNLICLTGFCVFFLFAGILLIVTGQKDAETAAALEVNAEFYTLGNVCTVSNYTMGFVEQDECIRTERERVSCSNGGNSGCYEDVCKGEFTKREGFVAEEGGENELENEERNELEERSDN